LVTLVTTRLLLSFSTTFPAAPIEQHDGCGVILLIYLSATGMRKENIAGARRKYPATGWLPDDYQIAEDLLLMINTETRSEG
jgi:hypothetical protein